MALTSANSTIAAPPHRSGRRLGLDATLALSIGLGGTAISAAGSWIPSLWGDEGASSLSAQRPLDTLWPMLGHIDSVHGVYYVMLHFWVTLFGASDFAIRFPSAIAVGIAAAGLVLLVRLFTGPRTAALAGIVFVLLPRVFSIGDEARSYAIGTMIAVWSTYVVVRLVGRVRPARRLWFAYAALVAVGIYVFLFFGLLLAAHAVYVISAKPSRAIVVRWLVAAASAVVVSAPIIYWDLSERNQVAFLATRNSASPKLILIGQWFGTVPFAAVAWTLIAVAVILAIARRRKSPYRLVVLGAAWLFTPMILLLIINFAIVPAYTTRYLSMSTPAAAILIVVGLGSLPWRYTPWIGVLLICALAVPNFVAQRSPYGKNGADFKQTAQYIGANAHEGDVVLFDETPRPSRSPRLAIALYPSYFTGLRDVELATPRAQTTGLWDVAIPLTDVRPEVQQSNTVWLATTTTSVNYKHRIDVSTLMSWGYRQVTRHTLNHIVVYEFARGS